MTPERLEHYEWGIEKYERFMPSGTINKCEVELDDLKAFIAAARERDALADKVVLLENNCDALKAERNSATAEMVRVMQQMVDYHGIKGALKSTEEVLKEAVAERDALRELLELAYAWVPQTDKPLLSKIEAALKTEDE